MRQNILSFFILLIAISCTEESYSPPTLNSLLTSNRWTSERANENANRLHGAVCFNSDGTYLERHGFDQDGDKIVITGEWNWTSAAEIFVIHKTISSNGENFALDAHGVDGGYRYILRVVRLSDHKLKVWQIVPGDMTSFPHNEFNYDAVTL